MHYAFGEANRRSDDLLQLATHGSLDTKTFLSLGMNREALAIFVARLETHMQEKTNDANLLEIAANERLKLANLTFSLSGNAEFSDPIQLGEIPEENQLVEGDVLEIYRKEGKKEWNAPLYIREHLVYQLRQVRCFLDNDGKRKLYVTGASGCGKTCFFWMLAGMLMKQGNRILFIQYRIETVCIIWILERGEMRQFTSRPLHSKDLDEVFLNLMAAQTDNFDLCICDGMIPGDTHGVHLRAKFDGHLASETGKDERAVISKLILISSFHFSVSMGQELVGDSTAVQSILFNSWRWEDYEKAMISDFLVVDRVQALFEQDLSILSNILELEGLGVAVDTHLTRGQILEVATKKYFYAGGSARYMFDMNINDLESALQVCCSEVPLNEWSAFADTALAAKATVAVNSLMQQFRSEDGKKSICTAVSKYVLLRAYEHCRTALSAAVDTAGTATNNSSLKGWAFELNQIDEIERALNANVTALKNYDVIAKTAVYNSKLNFSPRAAAVFDGETIVGDVESGSVIWCLLYNQSLYVVAFYFDATLVTLQFTVGATHSLKLEHIRPLRNAVIQKGAQVDKIVQLFVVKSNSEGFRFNDLTGHVGLTTSAIKAAAVLGLTTTFSVTVELSEGLQTKQVGTADVNWMSPSPSVL